MIYIYKIYSDISIRIANILFCITIIYFIIIAFFVRQLSVIGLLYNGGDV